jgi:predicted secreted protein
MLEQIVSQRRSLAIAWALAGSLCAPAALADDTGEAARRVRFSVESAREVENDWIRAVVGISAEDSDPAALAETVNGSMAWALERARARSAVKAKSGSYQTYPVHDKGRLRRWRASQTLILEGGDSQAMTELVGVLQERLQLQSFDFQVSHATRARVEEELVVEVLAAFRARAEQVREALGVKGYEIDEISLGTSGGPPRPVVRARMELAVSQEPAVEAGSSRVVVSANAAIVLE